jgi:NAD(P)-dependent dehydrogenase (short-subunit alcohol dehydrogenase family)
MSGVFITGATSGIGEQLAKDYAEEGWQVIACGRNQAKLTSLKQTYPSIHTLAFDVTDKTSVSQALSDLPMLPSLWIFNAGDCEYIDDGLLDSALFERIIAVNLLGVVRVIEAIQPYLSQGHQLAFVSSIAGELALPRAEAYGASKAALSYLSQTLALDLKNKQIGVSTIYPGFVQTPLTDKNDFPMPMRVSTAKASAAIRKGLARKQAHIYFPAVFTGLIRAIALLPYRLQAFIVAQLIKD